MFGTVARDQDGGLLNPTDRGNSPWTAARPRDRRWLIALMSLCVALASQGAAPGQDFEDEDDEDAAAAVDPNAFVLSEQQFNSWIFDDYQTGTAQFRERFQSMLSVRVAEMRRTCDLTESQAETLELAGRGDIHRFLDQVEQKRRRLQGKSYPQNDLNAIFQEIRPLQEKRSRGLFEDGSLFAKLSSRLLDAQQRERLEAFERDRRLYEYFSDIDRTLVRIGRTVGLTGAQREELRTLILQETRPPRRIGQRNYGYWFVLARMSQIPDEKLRPIFDEVQWPLARQYLQQGQGMMPFLKSNGYLDDDEGADPAPAKPEKE